LKERKKELFFPVFTVSNTGSVITAVTIATPVSLAVCMDVQMAENRGAEKERKITSLS